jgi:hypothetical protein
LKLFLMNPHTYEAAMMSTNQIQLDGGHARWVWFTDLRTLDGNFVHCLQARKQSRVNGPFKIKITLMTVCKGFHPNWRSWFFRDIFTSSQIQSYSDNSFLCQPLKIYSECLSIDHSLSTKCIHSTVPLFVDPLMSKEWSIETRPSTHWSPVSHSTNQKWLNFLQ